MAQKFNVGDRVRYVDGDRRWLNREGVVIKVIPPGKRSEVLYVMFDGHPCPHRRDGHWQLYSESFVLTEDTLVTALTAAIAPLFVKDKHDTV